MVNFKAVGYKVAAAWRFRVVDQKLARVIDRGLEAGAAGDRVTTLFWL